MLAAFLYLTPSVTSFWFLFLFAVFALANRGSGKATLALVFTATAGIIFRVALADLFRWRSVWHWLAIGLGTIVSGLCMGFLGAREQEHFARQQFLEKITAQLRFDRGLTESIRQALGEMMVEFECEQACLAFRDEELERLFVWRVRQMDAEAKGPEVFSLGRCETYLIDCTGNVVCLEFQGPRRIRMGSPHGPKRPTLPAPPETTRQEFGARSVMTVTLDFEGRPSGRFILVNPLQHVRNAAGSGRSSTQYPRGIAVARETRKREIAAEVLAVRFALDGTGSAAYRSAAAERVPHAQLARSIRLNPSAAAFHAICTTASCKRCSASSFSSTC